MQILSIEEAGSVFEIWYSDEVNYTKALIYNDNRIEIDTSVPIAKYPAGKYGGEYLTSYQYFAAVMGKFNPYTVFQINPIEVDSLDYNKLLDIHLNLER